jgi:hypothetical protein
MIRILTPFITIFTIVFMAGCKYDSAAPIRNIRFDPKLFGRMQAEGSTTCANHYFYDQDKRINLGVISSKYVLVAFNSSLNSDDRQQVLNRFGFVVGIAGQTSSRSASLYTVKLVNGLNCQQAGQALKEIAKDAAVVYVSPYFMTYENGKEYLKGVSNELQVKTSDSEMLKKVTESYNTAAVTVLDNETYLLALDKSSAGNALETANQLKNQPGIEMATPKFVTFSPNAIPIE